jgi:hypothetical protein
MKIKDLRKNVMKQAVGEIESHREKQYYYV